MLVLRFAFRFWFEPTLRFPPPPPPPPPPRFTLVLAPPPPPRGPAASGPAARTDNKTAMITRIGMYFSFITPLLFPGAAVGREDDLLRVAGRNEGERRVVVRGREVPGDRRGVLRPCGVVGRRQDELAREGIGSLLQPHLPVEPFLPERVLLAGCPLDMARADVERRRDPGHSRLVGPPGEKVGQRNLDVVFLVQHVR